MTVLRENDTFSLPRLIDATVIGEREVVVLPQGTTVAVVLVFGDSRAPVAYEVEAFLQESGRYALATVDASDLP